MTAQLAGLGVIICLLIWFALNARHWRAVQRWAQTRTRPRITWDDQTRPLVISAILIVGLALGLIGQRHWAFALAVILATIGCILESTVRVLPHLRVSEQQLAGDHIIMSLLLLAALALAIMGWSRLPPLVPGT